MTSPNNVLVSSPTDRDNRERHQRRLLISLGLIGLLGELGGVFTSLKSQANPELAIASLAVFLCLLILTFLWTGRLRLASHGVVALVGTAAFQLALSDKVGDYGLFLFFVFPATSFFLLGRRGGLAWSALLILVVGLVLLGYQDQLPYGTSALRDFAISFTATLVLVYLYQDLLAASEKVIAERNRVLTEQRNRLEAVVGAIGEGMLVIDSQRRITQANVVAGQLLQQPVDQLIGQTVEQVMILSQNSQLIDRTHQPASRCLQTGQTVVINIHDNYWLQVKSGSIYAVSIIASPLTQETDRGAVIVFRDSSSDRAAASIIEQQVIERTREVKEGWARLLASIEGLETAYVMTNEELTVVTKNRAMVELLTKITIVKRAVKRNPKRLPVKKVM